MAKTQWSNKKNPKRKFEGIYARRKGERIFELVPVGQKHGSKKGRKTFESWQLAKKAGFKRGGK